MTSITPKDLAEADQGFDIIVGHVVPYWRSVFVALTEEGFTEPQAMELLKVYIQKPYE